MTAPLDASWPSVPPWRGVIGRTVSESTPDWPARPQPGPDAPNVVVVVLDDTGFSHLGCYGSSIETPNIDALAAGGLRYNSFHTTALCSPTRAALLTGRNHHAVGMRGLSNWTSGFPNCTGRIPPDAATLAELLSAAGYSTLAVGKWHLTPMEETSAAGPFDDWPLRRGFDRFYGFMQGETSQFYPELYCDNHPIPTPYGPDEGYHVSEDLVDNALAMLRDQRSNAPTRPFFLYFCFGATHSPHQAPPHYLEKYRGRFDEGWDKVRDAWFARQLELGIVPAGTDLPPRNQGVRPWDELSGDEKRLALRLQEAFAGFLDHTDDQVGRLVGGLASLGAVENTLFVLISDNGASQEGGPNGMVDSIHFFNGAIETLDESLERIGEIGGPRANNNYPWGWAQAGNTPLKRYKQNTHGGGVRDPLIVHWPAGISERGSVRTQFCHVSDIAPTVLEVAGVPAPSVFRGVPQQPISGTSLAYTFGDGAGSTPTAKTVQHFEMLGHRGIYHDGWKAVAFHQRSTSFDEDRWELYHLEADFSECHDLAAERPEKLREMIERWWVEAGRYGVLPLDERSGELFGMAGKRRLAEIGRRFVFLPPVSHVNSDAAPPLGARSFTIAVEVDRPNGDEDGVLVSYGSVTSGICVYVAGGRVVFDYNLYGVHYKATSSGLLPQGTSTVEVAFERTGTAAAATVAVDGVSGAVVEIPGVLRMLSTLGMDIGADPGSPSCDDYEAPFPFVGSVKLVVFEIPERSTAAAASADGEALAAGARAQMSRQ